MAATGAGAPNVLLIVLDTVRADRLLPPQGAGNRNTNVDALAARGIRFDRFFSNSSWTLPAHASLFTGLYAVGHRATQETLELSAVPATLGELLSAAGYTTFGVSSNRESVVSVRRLSS